MIFFPFLPSFSYFFWFLADFFPIFSNIFFNFLKTFEKLNFSIFFYYYFYTSIGLSFKSTFWIIFISIHIFRKWQWRHHYYNRRGPSFSGQVETCFSSTFVRSSYIYRGFDAKLPNFGWIVFHTHHGLKHILTSRIWFLSAGLRL